MTERTFGFSIKAIGRLMNTSLLKCGWGDKKRGGLIIGGEEEQGTTTRYWAKSRHLQNW